MYTQETPGSDKKTSSLKSTMESKKGSTAQRKKSSVIPGDNGMMVQKGGFSHYTSGVFSDSSAVEKKTLQMKPSAIESKSRDESETTVKAKSLDYSTFSDAVDAFDNGLLAELDNMLKSENRVQESKVFDIITILGDGQKELIRDDVSVMEGLFSILDEDSFLEVLKILNGDLVWTFSYLHRLNEVEDIVFDSYINLSSNEELVELYSNPKFMTYLNRYTGNPLSWKLFTNVKAGLQIVFNYPSLAYIVITKSSPSLFLHWLVSDDSACEGFIKSQFLSVLLKNLKKTGSLKSNTKQDLQILYQKTQTEVEREVFTSKFDKSLFFSEGKENDIDSHENVQNSEDVYLSYKKSGSLKTVPDWEYQRILYSADNNELIRILSDDDVLDNLYYKGLFRKKNANINPLTIPGIANDQNTIIGILNNNSGFLEWVTEVVGHDTLLIFLAEKRYEKVINHKQGVIWLNIICDNYRLEPITDPVLKEGLKNVFLLCTISSVKKSILQARFGKHFITEDESDYEMLWRILEKMPISDFRQNTKIRQIGYSSLGEGVNGEYRNNNISINEEIESSESYTDKPFVNSYNEEVTSVGRMKGLNVHDQVVTHEVGHAVEEERLSKAQVQSAYTDDVDYEDVVMFSEMESFRSMKDVGSWKEYQKEGNVRASLINDMAIGSNLNTQLTETQTQSHKQFPGRNIKDIFYRIVSEIIHSTNSAKDLSDEGNMFDEEIRKIDQSQEWFSLWSSVKANNKVLEAVIRGGHINKPWENPDILSGERNFHEDPYKYSEHIWLSYLQSARIDKLRNYSFASPSEMFAEIYGTFYVTEEPGSIIKDWSPEVYNWFLKNVDKGYSIRAKKEKVNQSDK